MVIKQSLNMNQVFSTPEENELKSKIKISGSHSGNIFPVQGESGIIYLQEKARLLDESLLEFLPIIHPEGLNCATG
ncbi:MAG: hypothetical protein O8C67_05415 [Candidatus Methanoperedens sp.]|nr:hypothetical protein [Candidatus Methanoperedens sp.]